VSVLEEVRGRLAADRAAGLDFEEAWGRATADAPSTWSAALEATRPSWAAAYSGGADADGERVATVLAAVRAIQRERDDRATTAERRRGRVPLHCLIA
jgi:hypothetical protein